MRRLLAMLSLRDRLRGAGVLGALLVMAGVEVVGVAAVAAFIALLTDPSGAPNNRWIDWLLDRLGVADESHALLPVGLALFAVIVARNLCSGAVSWLRLAYLHHLRRTLSSRLLAFYLAAPYSFHLRANSATLTKNLLAETNQLVTTYLYSWMVMVADGVTCAAILVLLLYSDPTITILAVGVLGGLAAGVLIGSRRLVRGLGKTHRALNDQQFRVVGESLGGIKELKVVGREVHALARFDELAQRFARVTIAFQLLNEIPRYALEIVVFGGMLLLAWVALEEAGSISTVAGTLALFVVAFYRLLPVTHRMLSSAAGLNFNHAVLADLSGALRADARADRAFGERPAPLPFAREIRIDGMSFRYEGAAAGALDNINVAIAKGSAVAFVGPTGAGKSTLVDLVLGLHAPDAGAIRVDGAVIDDYNRRAWQANSGYVPQAIHLADDTIRRNIAFGLPEEAIDDARVAEAASLADLDRFVRGLPDGYATVVGERGVRLSGGQRQRIGIARALYGCAQLLILDEATSALDGITEAVIEDAIASLVGKVTVIIIAHRLSTVRRCDMIHLMDRGRIVASGTYADLLERSETFRAMARTA